MHLLRLTQVLARRAVGVGLVLGWWAGLLDTRAAAPVPFPFVMVRGEEGLASLKRVGDTTGLEFVRSNAVLGRVILRVRAEGGRWREATRSDETLLLRSQFTPHADALRWEIAIKNTGGSPLEIGDLELPLPMNTSYVWDHEETFVRRVFKHAFIAGDGSFLYWLPVKGSGSFLVLLPQLLLWARGMELTLMSLQVAGVRRSR